MGTARRAERADETRGRIVSAARSLFREHGFDATRTEQIASRAGVAKGTVFLHAGSKERLLLLVFETDLGYAVDRALASEDVTAPLPRALARVFEVFFRLYGEDVELARRFVKEQAVLQPGEHPLTRVTGRFMVGLESLIRVRQRRGEVAADVDGTAAARACFGLYYAVLLGWLGGWIPDPAARDRELTGALELFWRGLLTPTAG